MAAYIIVEIEVTDPTVYEEYKRLAPPSIAQYGGKYIVRGGPVDVLEGEWKPKRLVVLQFESADRARAWWSAEEYREPKAMRQRSARTKMVLVEGL